MSTGPRPVQFTRQSAERIAAVVRQAELTPFPGSPLEFDPVANAQGKKVFRVGSYSGAWPIDGDKVVTLRGSAATLSATGDIPVAGLALLLGIDRFMSEARALTNLAGNSVATVVIARWEGALDQETARRVLAGESNATSETRPTS